MDIWLGFEFFDAGSRRDGRAGPGVGMGYRFALSDASIGDGFRRIATEQIVRAIRAAGDTGRDTGLRIHEVRRRCKRLRGLLRLVRPGFSEFARENARIRDAAAGLSVARDRQVLLDTLGTLNVGTDHTERPMPAATAPETAPGSRDDAALAQFRTAMEDIRPCAEAWTVCQDGYSLIGKGLVETYRAARLRQRRAERLGTPEAFHRWRKKVKYLFYQLCLLQPSAPDIIPAFRRSAEHLSELLGQHHDLAMLTDVLRNDPESLAPGLDAPDLIALAARRQQELAASAMSLGNQLLAERPGALRRRFETYWHSWRGAAGTVAHRRAS